MKLLMKSCSQYVEFQGDANKYKSWKYLKNYPFPRSAVLTRFLREEMKFSNFGAYGYLEIVKYLVESGADVQAQNNQALINASRSNHFEVVKYLIENGANIQDQDNLALIYACYYNCLKIVKYLIDQGADVQARSNQALVNAKKNNEFKLIELLVKYGAKIPE